MNLRYIIEYIDKTSDNEANVDIGSIALDMKLDLNGKQDDNKFTSYYICAYGDDSESGQIYGTKIVYFDGEAVGVSTVTYEDEDVEWLSEELYYKVYNYLSQFVDRPYIHLADIDYDMPENYSVDYSCDLYTNTIHKGRLTYLGMDIKVKERTDSDVKVLIGYGENNQELAYVSNIKISYNIKENKDVTI